ncbi:alpha/beta hydrolase [Tumebacillus sp. ITR2]|uniref:Alpha/beta hydrolase n=1 Tax=Tumebacillus amylolyticus TaxID=2801339 RepID=A0ABS1JAJ9_9BACL|nr:alpha/beta hydrolase [Tumebacillus amylolyticus]MBL0387266.1 alpha/beta hydrolase [Tumebacillus amylolyticus]
METNPLLQPSSYRRRRRRITPLRVGLALLVLLLLAVPGFTGYVCYSLTHPAKRPVTINPEMLEMAYQDVTFASADGTKLSGWFLPAGGNDKLVIMSHGYTGNRVGDKPALPTAKALVEHGISVLMFDFRNSGMSDGSKTTVGAEEKNDLLSALKFAESQGYGGKGIGFMGYSMGAATSLVAAADAPEVKAVIADSPFADLTDYLHENLPYWSHLPNFPFTALMMWEIPLVTGHETSEVSPVGSAEKLRDRPILFIHGKRDKAIDVSNSEKIIKAIHGSKTELWSIAPADHVQTFEFEPVEYLDKVVGFFERNL